MGRRAKRRSDIKPAPKPKPKKRRAQVQVKVLKEYDVTFDIIIKGRHLTFCTLRIPGYNARSATAKAKANIEELFPKWERNLVSCKRG